MTATTDRFELPKQLDEESTAWLYWAMDYGDEPEETEPPRWAADIPRRPRPDGEPPWWASALAERQSWRADLAWLRWARGELDAWTVAAQTTGMQPSASAPSWASDLLWARWARGAATEAEVVALLGFDPGTDLAEAAPDWVRGS